MVGAGEKGVWGHKMHMIVLLANFTNYGSHEMEECHQSVYTTGKHEHCILEILVSPLGNNLNRSIFHSTHL